MKNPELYRTRIHSCVAMHFVGKAFVIIRRHSTFMRVPSIIGNSCIRFWGGAQFRLINRLRTNVFRKQFLVSFESFRHRKNISTTLQHKFGFNCSRSKSSLVTFHNKKSSERLEKGFAGNMLQEHSSQIAISFYSKNLDY
jgi:hypothetical protein